MEPPKKQNGQFSVEMWPIDRPKDPKNARKWSAQAIVKVAVELFFRLHKGKNSTAPPHPDPKASPSNSPGGGEAAYLPSGWEFYPPNLVIISTGRPVYMP